MNGALMIVLSHIFMSTVFKICLDIDYNVWFFFKKIPIF
jgi:hypothetical protein